MQDIYQSFYRSSDDKVIAGVCGGLAHKFHFSAGGMRLAFLALTIFSIGIFIYLALWILLKAVPTKNLING